MAMSEPGDSSEQQADRAVEHGLSMPMTASAKRADGLSGGRSSAAELGSGRRLDDPTRSFFETHLGHDFSGVRIHTESAAAESARSVKARAYTLGRDVVFDSGEYQPHTDGGKALLAHELAHTVQQTTGGRLSIQRKLRVEPGLRLNTMGYTTTKTGDVYTCPAISKTSLFNEVFTALLFSPRIFTIFGTTNAAVDANLASHMAARIGVVDFASKKKYSFGAGAAFMMNPDFWVVDHAAGTFYPKPGVDRSKAIDDLNVHPQKYAIACQAATSLTMEGGGKSPLVADAGGSDTDWIPGDWGYIANTNFPSAGGTAGLEGENIIYTGKDKFWGHFGPGIEYKTLAEWFDQVKSWNGGARTEDTRRRPTTGLA
jgi:hypothetical protein